MDTKNIIATVLLQPRLGTLIFALFRGEIPSRGFVFDVQNDHIPQDNSARIFWGLYEANEVRHVRKYLHPDLDVVEFGSGIGVISLEIIRVQARNRRLICVEANSFLVSTLERNLKRNTPWKPPIVLNRALDYSGLEMVNLKVISNNLGSHLQSEPTSETIHVGTTTLSSIVSQFSLREFALVSDAEGAEAGMILEDQCGLANCRQLIIELHPAAHHAKAYTPDDLCRALESIHGFRLVARRYGVHVFQR